MNRRQTLALLLSFVPAALAQNRLEIIPLRHRSADDVLPVLRPLLEPGATLSAHGHQLFVRTSPSNLAELRRVLESIDRPARRVQISVRFDDALEASRDALGVSGRAGSGGASIELRADQRSMSAADRIDQRVQVLEGGRATIYTG
jgi:type II secretory pathway component GspD/PulD (secretin)